MNCRECGAPEQKGNYCAECGAALGGACPECNADAEPGANYCTACGADLGGVTGGVGARGSRAPWIIAAAALLVVVLVLFLPRRAERVPAPGTRSAPITPTRAPGVPGLSADMRTNADRLFNRIMTAAEQGDQAEVERFMPMAIQAYDMVEALDSDGHYHLAILQTAAGDHDAAIRTTERVLAEEPGHLLALGVAARAATEAGDTATANGYWRRLLAAFPEQADRPVAEYLDHAQMLTEYRRMAGEAVGAP